MQVSDIPPEIGEGVSGVDGRLRAPSRSHQVAHTVHAIENGRSVDVEGPPGSGRTTFLHDVQSRLTGAGWRALALSGIPALLDRPLGALSAAGAISSDTARSGDLRTAVDELAERIPARRALIIIDDADDVDASTWAALTALRIAQRTPIVCARQGGDPRDGAAPGSALGSPHDTTTIELGALAYDEFSSLLHDRLDHPVDPSTAARIYAQTAGRPGLAVAAVDAAVRERRLTLSGGRISGVGSLWTPAIARPLRTLVDPLDAASHDLLTLLALLGDTRIDAMQALDPDDRLEGLERRSLVHLHQHLDRTLVAVDPPLLGDHLRATTRPALRQRLLRRAGEDAPTLIAVIPPTGDDDDAAHFVQGIQAGDDVREKDAAGAWESSGSTSDAVGYVRVLMRSATGPDPRIDSVLRRSREQTDDDGTRARWLIENAYNQCYLHRDAADAIDQLRRAAGTVGEHEGLVLARAAEIEIETELVGPPDLAGLRDPDDARLRTEVRAATHRAIGYARLVGGQPEDAARHLQAARTLAAGDDDPLLDQLETLTSIALGDSRAAVRAARRRLLLARKEHDRVALALHGSVLAFAALTRGLPAEAEDVLAEAAMLGTPAGAPPIAPFASLSLTVMTAVLTARTGHRGGGERQRAELDASPLPDGPLPGAQRAWARAQAELTAGETRSAAATLGTAGDTAWDRGARLAAAFAYTGALEIDPSPQRYERTADRIRSVDGDLVGAPFRLVTGLVASSPDTLVELGDAFADEQQHSLALAALHRAADLFADAHRPAGAAAARSRIERLHQAVGDGRYEPHRFLSTRVELTAREREVARLASRGLTNRQIAEELVLSTRTVESHLHRLMRKLRVERRAQLAERLEGVAPEDA